ncbi:MAG: alkaline phosphatase family protein [Chloroflexi bacterium SZAS-1]|nr:alkaline phosphatase family protein [Chloroflexi bacterium SZAS-1]
MGLVRRAVVFLMVGMLVGASLWAPQAQAVGKFNKINHVIVIFQENWSFDGLYGLFPGANGIANAGDAVKQVDKNGQPYPTLPQPVDTRLKPAAPDPRFPANLPVAPFNTATYVPADQNTGDLVHRFYQQQYQIDGGKMDKFVAWSDAAGLTMSYYDASTMPEGQLAQHYTMADNFFHAAFGGSFLNHFWLMCACSPVWPNAPASLVAQLDANGMMVKDGAVTPDGYVVNTSFTVNSPHPPTITNTALLVPQQTLPTIGDRLSAKQVSWAWYAGGWNDALAGHPAPLFQYHHQPFAYFANYADGTAAKAAHLKDEGDFLAALSNNTLPSVSFVKPLGPDNEHPGYTSLLRGQQHVADLVRAVQNSPYWKDTAIIITYDENGGRWDHVAPPKIDRWGPGTRVPAIIISPYAKQGFVDHTQYDTTSILKFIETRWNLPALNARDAAANDFANAFDFNQEVFPETGYGLSGDFQRYWHMHGGLPIFGFPLDTAKVENGFRSQWFERGRFEAHPENKAPYNVQLSRLGADLLARQGRPWESLPKGDPQAAHYFAQTGHAIAPQFWAYWSSHGLEFDGRKGKSFAESLALFGYPISEPQMEPNADGTMVLTQWYERARFEYYPDNPAPYQVLLGRLGAEAKP